MSKILDVLKSVINKIPLLPLRAMWAIYIYAAFLFVAMLVYAFMILESWHRLGVEPIKDMKDFCEVLFSSAAVTAVSFCARYFVDENKNGIPDEEEKEEKGRRP